MFRLFSAVLALVVCALAGAAQAEILNPPLTVPHYPWVYSIQVEVNYDAVTGEFSAVGIPWDFNVSDTETLAIYDEAVEPYTWATFSLTATISSTGQASGAELTVTGDYNGTFETLFHSTDLQQFGFDKSFGYDFAADKFEFVFAQGADATLGTAGEPVAVYVHGAGSHTPSGQAPTDWSTSFTNKSANGAVNGYSDTYYMPEPSMSAVLALGGLLFLRRRRRR